MNEGMNYMAQGTVHCIPVPPPCEKGIETMIVITCIFQNCAVTGFPNFTSQIN